MAYRKLDHPRTPEETRAVKREWWRRFRESKPQPEPPIQVGETFDRLTVFEVYPTTGGRFRVKAQCVCGNVVDERPRYLKIGKVKSCGCLQREVAPEFYEHKLKERQRHA